jgi:LysR family transcriptional regulator, chromosome initiation inhibitor
MSIMLDYKLIEAMAMVAQEGGFDKAARVLHITQSAVSQRLRLLEEQTGQILIARTTPPRTTPAGRKLLTHYLKVKRLEDDLIGEMDKPIDTSFTSIAVGLNADSLASWFLHAVRPFLLKEHVLLDIRVEDQEQTHRLLKDGDVIGCISSQELPLQGCRIDYIGRMTYHMLAAPRFAKKWFPDGLTIANACRAPAIIYNRKDLLHYKLFQQAFGDVPDLIPANYVPSYEKFSDFITMGLGYGMLPLQQSEPLVRSGRLVNLSPDCNVSVKLYWHCWNLKSKLLEELTKQLILETKTLLEE